MKIIAMLKIIRTEPDENAEGLTDNMIRERLCEPDNLQDLARDMDVDSVEVVGEIEIIRSAV